MRTKLECEGSKGLGILIVLESEHPNLVKPVTYTPSPLLFPHQINRGRKRERRGRLGLDWLETRFLIIFIIKLSTSLHHSACNQEQLWFPQILYFPSIIMLNQNVSVDWNPWGVWQWSSKRIPRSFSVILSKTHVW